MPKNTILIVALVMVVAAVAAFAIGQGGLLSETSNSFNGIAEEDLAELEQAQDASETANMYEEPPVDLQTLISKSLADLQAEWLPRGE